MNDRGARNLVIVTAFVLLLAGVILFLVFDKLGIKRNEVNNYVYYDVYDYIEISPVLFNTYDDVYRSISVSKVNIKNLDSSIIKDFNDRQEEIIEYISAYYNQLRFNISEIPESTVSSTIKTQVNGTVLSILYKLDFNLDKSIFSDYFKSYFVTINIDLRTNTLLTNEDLLNKYSYAKNYISDKLFNEVILMDNGSEVIDKDTNLSLTKSDIEKRKNKYVEGIINEFDNIIRMYIENGSLVLVYNSKELKSIFFDNEFDTDIKFRYLK